jgi:hypothetical protein
MDDDMQAIEAGTELERRLAFFAYARLSPDPSATARTRARVMREARLSFEAARIAVHVAPSLAATRRSIRRRIVMPFLAAGLWLGIAVVSISAAQPGGPLYQSRMWIESAALPGAPGARTSAELERLDARLAEAFSGAARGDRAAVSAALEAYGLIADEVTAQSAGYPDLEALVAAALNRHQAVLTAIAAGLSDRGNATAADAIERNIQRAIERNAAVIVTLGRDPAAPQGGGGGTSGTRGTDAGAGTGGSGSSDSDGATSGSAGSDGASASATPEPNPTPIVRPTPQTGGADKPAKTPRPVHTPPSDHAPGG